MSSSSSSNSNPSSTTTGSTSTSNSSSHPSISAASNPQNEVENRVMDSNSAASNLNLASNSSTLTSSLDSLSLSRNPNHFSNGNASFLSPTCTASNPRSISSKSPSRSPSRILTSLPNISTTTTDDRLPFSPTHTSPINESAQDQIISFGASLRAGAAAGGMMQQTTAGLDSLGASIPSSDPHAWLLKKKSSSRGIAQVFDQAKELDNGRKEWETTSQSSTSTSDPPLSVQTKSRPRQGSQPILGIQTSSLSRDSSTKPSSFGSNQFNLSSSSSSAQHSSTFTPLTSSIPSAYPPSSLYTPITSGISNSHSKYQDSDLGGYEFDTSGPRSAISTTSYNTSLASHERSGSRDKADFEWERKTSAINPLEEARMEVMREEEGRPQLQASLLRTPSNRSRSHQASNFSINATTSETFRTSRVERKDLRDYAISVSSESLFDRLESIASRRPDLVSSSDQRDSQLNTAKASPPHSHNPNRPSTSRSASPSPGSSSSSSSSTSSFSNSKLPLLILDFRSHQSFGNKRIRDSINLSTSQPASSTATLDPSHLLLTFNSPMSKRKFSASLGPAFGSSRREDASSEKRVASSASSQTTLGSDETLALPPFWNHGSDILLVFNSASPSPSSSSSEGRKSTTSGALSSFGGSDAGTTSTSTSTSPATSPGDHFRSTEAIDKAGVSDSSQSMAWQMARHLRENERERVEGDGNLYFMPADFQNLRKMQEDRESFWIEEGEESRDAVEGEDSATSLSSSGTLPFGSNLQSPLNTSTNFYFSGLTIASPRTSAFAEPPREVFVDEPHEQERRESGSTIHAPSPRSATATSPPQRLYSDTPSKDYSPAVSSTRLASPPSASPSASKSQSPARPGRPSLARLDTSERVKTLRSLQAAVPTIGQTEGTQASGTRQAPAGLSLDTSVQRHQAIRSATLGPSIMMSGTPSASAPRRPSLGLVIDSGRGGGSRSSSRNASISPTSNANSPVGHSNSSNQGHINFSSQVQPLRVAEPESTWSQDFSFGTADPTIPFANGPRSASVSEAGLSPYPGSEAWFLRGARSLNGALSIESGPTTAIPTIGGAAAGGQSEFSRHFSSPASPLSISEILPNFLYLGPDITSVHHVRSLQAQGVKRILNMAVEIDPETALLDAQLGEGKPMKLVDEFEKYHRVPMRDTVEETGVQAGLLEVCGFLDDARLHSAPVYVHCKAGKSRSVTAVMAYLIHAYRWSLSRAYSFVAERREVVSPNIGFVAELMTFEQRSRTLSMVSSGGSSNGNSQDEQGKGEEIRKQDRRIRDSLPIAMSSTKSADVSPAHRSSTIPTVEIAPASSSPDLATLQDENSSLHVPSQASPLASSPSSYHYPSHQSGSSTSMVPPPQLAGMIHKPETEESEAEFEIEIKGSDGRYRSKIPPFSPNLVSTRRATLSGVDSANSFGSPSPKRSSADDAE